MKQLAAFDVCVSTGCETVTPMEAVRDV